jgi:hypothetical protein
MVEVTHYIGTGLVTFNKYTRMEEDSKGEKII